MHYGITFFEKGVFNAAIKIGWSELIQIYENLFVKFNNLQAIQNVDEFVSSSEQIWKNYALNL